MAHWNQNVGALLMGLGTCGSGGVLWSHSRVIVCFSEASEVPNGAPLHKMPDTCGKGHPLTPENLHVDDREQRWRCRQCGRERAAALRMRFGPGVSRGG
jgi:hypothetical protein